MCMNQPNVEFEVTRLILPISPVRQPRHQLSCLDSYCCQLCKTLSTRSTRAQERSCRPNADPWPRAWTSAQFRKTCHGRVAPRFRRSEEHTSELQSQSNLVCRLLL